MTLVYQAYGREYILKQTLFSIVTLLAKIKMPSQLKIVIYTDTPEFFKNFFSHNIENTNFPVRLEVIGHDQLQKWRGAINFVHRVKLEILRHAGDRINGPLYYVDGDTYFREDPTSVFSQVSDQLSLMHVAENSLKEGRDPLSKKISKFVKKNKFIVMESQVEVSPDTVMWNAGAIGISQANKSLFAKMIELTDQMYALYPKHIMEQLAVSYYLLKSTKVVACDYVIGHYWNQKDEYDFAINEFLIKNSTWDLAKNNLNDFNWPKPFAPVPKRNLWQKIFRI